ncbi:YiiX/YebB-like N1pC/P60 family cysteine hydrolase [Ectobacillus panaciterrae]|uniref:YiiX/YebB-like N1pC/P60 family cysteine hydrolase n=1 Tax=Ectobacillus panaciterrae TaxID=363872 RepID=UPI00041C2608|nr:YiiX/YebB-like N1pC/P60 family cysteine hydrolase [Ectobacillus panaciterrae]
MGTTKFNNLKKMSYQNARMNINTGDILLCSGNHLISELIKQFSNSIFSHVGFIFIWNERILVMESVEDDGVRIVPLSHYLYNYENSQKPYDGTLYIGRHQALDAPEFDHESINKMLGKAADLLNLNYDKDEIAKILSRIVLGVTKHVDNNEYICSEFVDVCFKQIGIEFPRDSTGFIYPEHIAADPYVNPLFQIYP